MSRATMPRLLTALAVAGGLLVLHPLDAQAVAPGTEVQPVRRTISMDFKPTNGGQRFRLFGIIKPLGVCADDKLVTLQRKASQGAAWADYQQQHSAYDGRYNFTDLNQAGYFRTVVAAETLCRRAESKVIRVTKNARA